MAAVYASGFGEALVRDATDAARATGSAGGSRPTAGPSSTPTRPSTSATGWTTSTPKFRSVLSIPLSIGKDAVGVVTLYSSQANAFREEQRQGIELISGPIAEAFGRAIKAESSRRDDLGAGLLSRPNAHALHALLERDGGFLAGPSRTLGVLCVRIVGSPQVLVQAAAAVSQATRVADLIYQTGRRLADRAHARL